MIKTLFFIVGQKDEGSVKTFEKLNELQERFGQENPLRFAELDISLIIWAMI